MNVGVVCELNPLHNGHAAVFEYAKNLGNGGNNVIAVMSGNYTQRGEPALVDKWTRGRMAVIGGADMVLEIPSVFAQQSAQFFAEAAVDVICKAGIIDALVFGSESGDVGLLEQLAKRRLDGDFGNDLRKLLDAGLSYPRAVAEVYGRALDANDILGVEYIVALRRRGSGIKVYAMKRVGGVAHKDLPEPEKGVSFTSAGAIRKAVFENRGLDFLGEVMPGECAELLKERIREGRYVPSMAAYDGLIVGKLREIGPSGIEEFPFAGGGLAECIYSEACKTSEMSKIIAEATGRSYTSGRIRRILLAALTGARRDMFGEMISVPYVRVLAVSKKNEGLISEIFRCGTPVIAGNIPKNYKELFPGEGARLLGCEILATDYYIIGFVNKNEAAHKELTTPLLKV